jgi:2'-5' RNA ligase
VRLFVAIEPPAAVLDELAAGGGGGAGRGAPPTPRRTPGAPPPPPPPARLRWTGRTAWHVTLAFLGEVDERVADRLPPRLERAATRHEAMTLSLAGGGAFPGPSRARVLWTAIRGDVRPLGALAASVAASARRAGVALPAQQRAFRAHLTLARCTVPADVRPLVESLAGYAGAEFAAAEIHLIRSYLGAQPRYETLGSWPLRARTA